MSTKRGDLCGETARELKDRREGGTVLERVNRPVFDKLWDQTPREPLLRHVAVSFMDLCLFKVIFYGGFYHGKSPFFTTIWGICLSFFPTATLSKSKWRDPHVFSSRTWNLLEVVQ